MRITGAFNLNPRSDINATSLSSSFKKGLLFTNDLRLNFGEKKLEGRALLWDLPLLQFSLLAKLSE